MKTVEQHKVEQRTDAEQVAKPKPYGFWRTVVIVLSGHLGVRPSHKRVEDFARANGVYVFAVAVMYFVLVIIGLIVLVNVVVS
jgi:dienelactone hydrolase